MAKTCKELRDEFIKFFEERSHRPVSSSSLLPADDPTLLFANAGMNQFKPIFLGTETRSYSRAVNTQKCIRAGGKHNDLEDVGRDCYHHTFFEMLGNWSFGDYFKAEAIEWAWELFVKVWGLPADRLHATYFQGDENDGLEPDIEARDLWLKYLPPERVHPGNRKDNFWEMGETGPCGPCSEIHIDITEDGLGGDKVNADSPLVIELWNLVFIQFNKLFTDKGKYLLEKSKNANAVIEKKHFYQEALEERFLEPLPARHVDTGLGLERVGKVLQGKKSNYATDLFVPIIEAVEKMTDHRYGTNPKSAVQNPKSKIRNPKLEDRFDTMDEQNLGDVAMRVIVDHARCLTFAIADGILPSNDGRGSVLRSILRRAAGVGRQDLRIEGTFIHKLVLVVVDIMGDAFPNLIERKDYVAGIIKDEEESFAKTLDRGLGHFWSCVFGVLKTEIQRQQGRQGILPDDQIYVVRANSYLTQKQVDDLDYRMTFMDASEEIKFCKIVPSQDGLGINVRETLKSLRLEEISPNIIAKYYSSPPVIKGARGSFELHTTYGFPFTLTKLMAEKHGLSVDEADYEKLMEEHRQISSAGGSEKFQVEHIVGLPATNDSSKYDSTPLDAKVLGWVIDGKFLSEGELSEGTEAAVVLDRTNFYGEAGGQVGDCGELPGQFGAFDVNDTQLAGQCVLHVGKVRAGKITVGQTVRTLLCPLRINIMRNHTATHLMNWALARVLGENVNQAGSVVDRDRLRFDFTHNSTVTAEQLAEVEKLVNQRILGDEIIHDETIPLSIAQKIPGVRAVFGEKYPDPVRVVAMGSDDPQNNSDPEVNNVEFCGGVHLGRTGQVGFFKIVGEESVAKGVRRITAVTGPAVIEWVQRADATLREAGALLKVPAGEIPNRIIAMQDEIKKLRKKPAGGGSAGLSDEIVLETPAGKILVARSSSAEAGVMRNICDQQRQKGAVAVFLGVADEEDGKVLLIAMVSDELVKAGKLKAGDWVKHIAPIVGGGGGGKATLAQAGGKLPDKLPEALQAAAEWAKEQL